MKLGSGRDVDTQTVWTYLILVQFWGHALTILVTLELLRRSGIRSMRSRLKFTSFAESIGSWLGMVDGRCHSGSSADALRERSIL